MPASLVLIENWIWGSDRLREGSCAKLPRFGHNSSGAKKSSEKDALANLLAKLFFGAEFQFICPVGLPVVMKGYRIRLGDAAARREFVFRTLIIVDAASELDGLTGLDFAIHIGHLFPRNRRFHESCIAIAPHYQLSLGHRSAIDGRLWLAGEEMFSRHAWSQ